MGDTKVSFLIECSIQIVVSVDRPFSLPSFNSFQEKQTRLSARVREEGSSGLRETVVSITRPSGTRAPPGNTLGKGVSVIFCAKVQMGPSDEHLASGHLY